MPEATVQLPIASGRDIMTELRSRMRGRWVMLSAILLLFLTEAATALVFPVAIGGIVDAVAVRAPLQVMFLPIVCMTMSALAAGVLTWAGGTALARLAETVVAELREHVVEAALSLPRSKLDASTSGDIVTRASDDIARISETLPAVIPRLCVSFFTVVLVIGSLATLDPRYLLAFLLTTPVYIYTVRRYLSVAPGAYANARSAHSERAQHILETLTQRSTVIALRLTGQQLNRIRDATWLTVKWAMRTRIMQNRLFGGLNIAEGVGLAVILGVGVWQSLEGTATVGAVTGAALLYLRTVAPIDAVLFLMDDLQQAAAALGRVIGVQRGTTQGAGQGERHLSEGSAPGQVALVSVSFAYAQVPVLHDVTLTIQPGEVVAVVGATGSGKSTLAALLAGDYSPTSGRIERGVSKVRIATVAQETHLFDGTLRENLTLAHDDSDGPGEMLDLLLLQAMEDIGAGDLVRSLPDGLDTRVGRGGELLTKAQEQLVSLGRVLLADPALVILDEATAEADTADGGRLEHAAARVTHGRAALVIAHRLEQAASADRVVVLERGRIIEEGAHAELCAAGGVYARYWEAHTRRSASS
ncbi:MAG: ABC transporter ATP-binding protein [Leucobacter sp.]